MRLSIDGFSDDDYSVLTNQLNALVKLTCNVRALELYLFNGYMPVSNHSMKICNIIHNRIRHVTLSISSVEQMFMFLPHLRDRSSVSFNLINTDCSAAGMYRAWWISQKVHYTHQLGRSSLHLWLDSDDHRRKKDNGFRLELDNHLIEER